MYTYMFYFPFFRLSSLRATVYLDVNCDSASWTLMVKLEVGYGLDNSANRDIGSLKLTTVLA